MIISQKNELARLLIRTVGKEKSTATRKSKALTGGSSNEYKNPKKLKASSTFWGSFKRLRL